MADIELVIKIPEEAYVHLRNGGSIGASLMIENAIKNGTPLPKGHGVLIDADELYEDFIDGTEGYDCHTWTRIEIGDSIENAHKIIEAEKSHERSDEDLGWGLGR